MRQVDIYLWEDTLLFVSISRNEKGFSVLGIPHQVSRHLSPALIGAAVMRHLEESRVGIDAEGTKVDEWVRPLGAKNWLAFIKKVSACDVRQEPDGTLLVWSKARERTGFSGTHRFDVPSEDSTILGETVLRALSPHPLR